jgi:hypothetical protein
VTDIRITKDRAEWRKHGWTSMPNALVLQSDISWEAKGAFTWLSLAADDPDFDVDADSLANAGPKGRDHARKLIRELEEHGWLSRRREVGERGVPEVVYELHPVPVPPEERTLRPSTARPRRGTFSLVNSERLNVQASEVEQPTVDNSPAARGDAGDPGDISAVQGRKTERVGPARVGPARSVGHTSSSERTTPPPLASSGEREAKPEEEEDVAAFWEAMPGDYRPGIAKRAGGCGEVRRLLRTRTPQVLATEVMSAPRPRGGVRVPVRWVLAVLRDLPDHPPAAGAGQVAAECGDALPPACPACLAGNPAAQSNPRWRYRDGRMCDCHPDAAGGAAVQGAASARGQKRP